MAYTIYNNDGTVLSTIAVGEVDSYSTSLDLLGKNVNNYGEYFNNDLVKLLTSFASPDTEPPRSPQTGQMWFDKTAKRLKVYDGVSFQPTYGSHVSGTQPITTSTGDFWYDTVNSQLKVWDGDNYNLVGPATSGLLGQFGILPAPTPIRDDYSKVAQKASLINSYGSYVGILTTASFVMEASSSTIYLGINAPQVIRDGLTIFKDAEVRGSLFVNGWDVRNHPDLDLSTYYNITPFGTYTATMTTSSFGLSNSNFQSYTATNYAIARDLAMIFDTHSTIEQSEVAVTCAYNSEISVRKFKLRKVYPQQNWPWWEPMEDYQYTFTATSTSTVGQVRWLWTSTAYTNIVQPAWNETIRTDSVGTPSNSYLNPVTVDVPFYIKITNGVPGTGFTYSSDIMSGSGTLDNSGAFTTSTTITTSMQPTTGSNVTYTIGYTFYATGNQRSLSFIAHKP